MGGLQRGRAGGCNVMRRPQVAAEFKESTFNFNFNLTFAKDSLLIQSSKCSIFRKEQLRTLRLELAKKQRMVSQHQLIENIALTFRIDKTKKKILKTRVNFAR